MAEVETQHVIITIISNSVPYIVGFVSAMLVEPIRKKIFKPKLKLEFENNQDYVTLTPEDDGWGKIKAYYIRVRIKNLLREGFFVRSILERYRLPPPSQSVPIKGHCANRLDSSAFLE